MATDSGGPKKNFTTKLPPSHNTGRKRILQEDSLAQHWARDWRALALTQAQCCAKKNLRSGGPGRALCLGVRASPPLFIMRRPRWQTPKMRFFCFLQPVCEAPRARETGQRSSNERTRGRAKPSDPDNPAPLESPSVSGPWYVCVSVCVLSARLPVSRPSRSTHVHVHVAHTPHTREREPVRDREPPRRQKARVRGKRVCAFVTGRASSELLG